jgi:hypothetical protein
VLAERFSMGTMRVGNSICCRGDRVLTTGAFAACRT